MKTLICMMGFPRSGKSTWVRKQRFPIVSPDALRQVLYGQPFWAPGETLVWTAADIMVRALFGAGNDVVILDATNMTRCQREQWLSDEWVTKFHYINTNAEECVRRAIEGKRDHLVSVIRIMSEKFQPLESDEEIYENGN